MVLVQLVGHGLFSVNKRVDFGGLGVEIGYGSATGCAPRSGTQSACV